MSKNKYYLAVGVITLLITVAGVTSVAYAHNQGFRFGFNKPYLSEEQRDNIELFREKHQDIKEAIENNDYDAWQDLMNEGVELIEEKLTEMKGSITEENFEKLVEIHELIEQGKFEEAREMRAELDFRHGFGHGPGHGLMFR